MLRDSGMINPDNYIGIPDQMGNVKYYREDLFDDLPDQEFNELMMNATPYDMLGDLADNHKRRFQRRQFKLDKKEAKRQAKADRQAQRQQAKADRVASRQASKTDRAEIRGENIAGIVESGGALVGALGGLVDGDQTGATIDFGTGQGVQVDGTIGVGAQKNFITDSSIIPGVPNYIILAGAGLGAFLLLKK